MRRERFAREYVLDQNGTRSAIAAGYSKKTAGQAATRLLKNVQVQELIARFSQKVAQKLEITADRVLNEIAKLAFADPRKFFNQDGTAKRIEDLDDETAAALAGVEVVEEFSGAGKSRRVVGRTKKFKLADKGQNLERLGRYLKLFTDKVQIGIGEALAAPSFIIEIANSQYGSTNKPDAGGPPSSELEKGPVSS